jgi:2-dehydro-3-deoxyphosphooctonate aldolase (KDO 8-P synthase)
MFKLIAGPCVIESYELLEEVVETLLPLVSKYDFIDFYFKSSYKKANRTSAGTFTGLGDELAISYLAKIKEKYKVKICTDVHTNEEIDLIKDVADIIQIPAFLSRQTELIVKAAETGKIVNIKKGQFLSPNEMEKAAKKAISTGNDNVWLTERGTFFGYHDLVVDFRSLIIMKNFGYPVIYDATHSVQRPSFGEISGGQPEFILPLAKAALAVGVNGLFIETHPNPPMAFSDSASQLPLNRFGEILEIINRFFEK